jgi:hypothetical protein
VICRVAVERYAYAFGVSDGSLDVVTQTLERQQSGASQRRVASFGIELPGKNSNLDEESQNPIAPRSKSHKNQRIAAPASMGVVPGVVNRAKGEAPTPNWPRSSQRGRTSQSRSAER